MRTERKRWCWWTGRSSPRCSRCAGLLAAEITEDLFQFNTTSNAFYDEAARNCIDVGNYVGRCLASAGLEGSNLHLVGHSLGAHLVVRE